VGSSRHATDASSLSLLLSASSLSSARESSARRILSVLYYEQEYLFVSNAVIDLNQSLHHRNKKVKPMHGCEKHWSFDTVVTNHQIPQLLGRHVVACSVTVLVLYLTSLQLIKTLELSLILLNW
jgi:hypothetical protein